MSTRVTVDDAILVSAVRYAIPRPRLSYIASWTVDEVLRVWDDLSDNAKTVIVRDVRRELSDAENFPGIRSVGDRESWERLIARVGNE